MDDAELLALFSSPSRNKDKRNTNVARPSNVEVFTPSYKDISRDRFGLTNIATTSPSLMSFPTPSEAQYMREMGLKSNMNVSGVKRDFDKRVINDSDCYNNVQHNIFRTEEKEEEKKNMLYDSMSGNTKKRGSLGLSHIYDNTNNTQRNVKKEMFYRDENEGSFSFQLNNTNLYPYQGSRTHHNNNNNKNNEDIVLHRTPTPSYSNAFQEKFVRRNYQIQEDLLPKITPQKRKKQTSPFKYEEYEKEFMFGNDLQDNSDEVKQHLFKIDNYNSLQRRNKWEVNEGSNKRKRKIARKDEMDISKVVCKEEDVFSDIQSILSKRRNKELLSMETEKKFPRNIPEESTYFYNESTTISKDHITLIIQDVVKELEMEYSHSTNDTNPRDVCLKVSEIIPPKYREVFKYTLFNPIQSHFSTFLLNNRYYYRHFIERNGINLKNITNSCCELSTDRYKKLTLSPYVTSDIVLYSSTASGKTAALEMAIINHLINSDDDNDNNNELSHSTRTIKRKKDIRIVYLCPFKTLCAQRAKEWRDAFGITSGITLTVRDGSLEDEELLDFDLLLQQTQREEAQIAVEDIIVEDGKEIPSLDCNILVCTPEKYNILIRNNEFRVNVLDRVLKEKCDTSNNSRTKALLNTLKKLVKRNTPDLLLIDECDMIWSERGDSIEAIFARLFYNKEHSCYNKYSRKCLNDTNKEKAGKFTSSSSSNLFFLDGDDDTLKRENIRWKESLKLPRIICCSATPSGKEIDSLGKYINQFTKNQTVTLVYKDTSVRGASLSSKTYLSTYTVQRYFGTALDKSKYKYGHQLLDALMLMFNLYNDTLPRVEPSVPLPSVVFCPTIQLVLDAADTLYKKLSGTSGITPFIELLPKPQQSFLLSMVTNLASFNNINITEKYKEEQESLVSLILWMKAGILVSFAALPQAYKRAVQHILGYTPSDNNKEKNKNSSTTYSFNEGDTHSTHPLYRYNISSPPYLFLISTTISTRGVDTNANSTVILGTQRYCGNNSQKEKATEKDSLAFSNRFNEIDPNEIVQMCGRSGRGSTKCVLGDNNTEEEETNHCVLVTTEGSRTIQTFASQRQASGITGKNVISMRNVYSIGKTLIL